MTTARAYYNEINPHAAQTLRNLIAAGHIAHGDVDERSIKDVHPDDIKPYTQCHFFAGIGVWSLALRRAGWPDELPVWTGSCPCQPYSKAGKGLGFADERDLWPDWFHLIQERKPPKILGEQVADAIKHGWIDRLYSDLEAEGYAVGALRFGADTAGAPIERQRIYLVAERLGEGMEGQQPSADSGQAGSWGWRGQEDLRAIANAPFQPGDRWPQPLVRRVDDGLAECMDQLHAIGNAINADAAALFIRAYMTAA